MSKDTNPYIVYLKSELGKLRNLGDAKSLIVKVSKIPADFMILRKYGFPSTASKLSSKFHSQKAINSFVYSLDEKQICEVSRILSEIWRKNSVFRKIRLYTNWKLEDIPIESIYVGQAEPRLKDLFNKNRYKLTCLIRDSNLWMEKPYCNYKKEDTISYPICLATKGGDGYRIFDGIHRAILLCYKGEKRLTLLSADARFG